MRSSGANCLANGSRIWQYGVCAAVGDGTVHRTARGRPGACLHQPHCTDSRQSEAAAERARRYSCDARSAAVAIAMMGLPARSRTWIAACVIHMRCGFNSLAAKVEMVLQDDPFNGHMSVFRDRRGYIINCW